MKAIKLTSEQYQRSLRSSLVEHLWLYKSEHTTQRNHNNTIFLTKTIGMPFACLVIEKSTNITNYDLENVFGKGTFYEGGVSPDDKENMNEDVFFVRK